MDTNSSSKDYSRRQLLKALAATAGAASLASLPATWSTPILNTGVLPAHAQTSGTAPEPTIASCELTINSDGKILPTYQAETTCAISPLAAGISMTVNIERTPIAGGTTATYTETITTDLSGMATFPNISLGIDTIGYLVTATFAFSNAADGTGTCEKTATY